VLEYRVTVVRFGRVFTSVETVARMCEVHLNEMAEDGWRLVHADRRSSAIAGYWIYTWERSALPTGMSSSWSEAS
jgi:hypothetical protein